MDSCLSIKKSLASPYHCRQNTSLAGTHGVPRHSAVRHRHCGATTTSSMGSTKTNHQRNCEHIRADFPIKRNASCTPGPSHDWTRPAGAHLVAHGNSIVEGSTLPHKRFSLDHGDKRVSCGPVAHPRALDAASSGVARNVYPPTSWRLTRARRYRTATSPAAQRRWIR